METSLARKRALCGLAGNSGWSVTVQVTKTASLMVVAILLARYLGPEVFGIFAMAFSIVKIFSVAAGFGLDQIVVKRVIEGRDERLVGKVVRLRLVGGALGYGLALATAFILEPRAPGVLLLVAVIGPTLILQAAGAFELSFQAESRMKLVALATAPALFLAAAAKIFAMLLGASLVVFAWLELMEGLLVAVGILVTYRVSYHEIARPKPDSERRLYQILLRQGFPLLLSSLAVIAYMRVDLLMLGVIRDPGAVGIYSAAAQLSEVWSLFPVALMPALLPYFLGLRQRDSRTFQSALSLLYGLASIGALSISLVVSVFAPTFISWLFGPDYEDSASILQVHIWSLVFIYLGLAQSIWSLSEDRLWLGLIRTAGGAVLNIFLNLVLIPSHGPLGAAVATLISYSASAVWLNAFSRHTRGVLRLQLRALLIVPFLWHLRAEGWPSMKESTS